MKKQIIVSGGGGFYRKNPHYEFEKYVIEQSGKQNPKICFLPQASSEQPSYILAFQEHCLSLDAQPTWVSLFGRVEPGWEQKILDADIVFVGGGNTKSMLALWKAWGVDQVLRAAYEKGVLLSGTSAGMICWFQQGITDSVWPLGVVEGLGLLSGSACPHFDSEVERQDFYLSGVKSGAVAPGIALQDYVAAHYIDGRLHNIFRAGTDKKGFGVTPSGLTAL